MMSSRRWALTVALAAVGCGDDPDPAVPPQPEGALLTRRDAEPAGSHCPRGGTAVRAGRDRDGDGVLADAEIDDTTELCGSLELWSGDFTADDWKDPVKVAALAGARVVSGALTIVADAAVELPALEVVANSLTIAGPQAAVSLPALRRVAVNARIATGRAPISLPALREVGDALSAGAVSVGLALPVLHDVGGRVSVSSLFATVSLAALEEIHGDLVISGDGAHFAAPALRTIEGAFLSDLNSYGDVALPGLTAIGGDVTLQGQPSRLRLDKLVSIGGAIDFDRHVNLAYDVVLPALERIGGDVTANDPGLASIDLPRLTHLAGRMYVSSVPRLSRISLPRLVEVAGDIYISDAAVLAAIDLASLERLEGLSVGRAPALTKLSVPALQVVFGFTRYSSSVSIGIDETKLQDVDFASLRSVAGTLGIADIPTLRSVTMPQLTQAHALAFQFDPALETVTAPQITELEALTILDASIRRLDFAQLVTVSDFLSIDGGSLSDLSALRSLESVGTLRLQFIDRVKDLRGLASLRHVASLDLGRMLALTSLDGLERVTDLSGYLVVESNALTSVAGLRNLTHVGSLMRIYLNTELTDLALPSLLTVDGPFSLTYMDRLTSLSGLAALRSIGGDLEIRQNNSLTQDEVRAFMQRIGR